VKAPGVLFLSSLKRLLEIGFINSEACEMELVLRFLLEAMNVVAGR
jgi:hypothetical protein